jgi:hypothetical protein
MIAIYHWRKMSITHVDEEGAVIATNDERESVMPFRSSRIKVGK